jgi:flagellar M-ring protein FliF
VHLALPNQNGFFREQQKPSASVVLTLYPGRALDRGQIAGIVHLVSSSVPEMSVKAVSIVDQTGALLSGPQDAADTQAGLDAQQLQYVRQIETNYTQRIRDILEPVIGKDNLRAQVTAEIDFSQVEATAEEYKPNQDKAQAAIRSQQSSEQQGQGAASPAGVPGAASNQPPTPATAPVNGASQPLQAAGGGTAGGTSRRDNVTNYEVDKTVKVIRNGTGNIRRLNAAVVLNHRTVTDAKGKTSTQAIPQEELDKLTALVRESIGMDDKRGDSIKVINTPFQIVKEEVDETPLWKRPETIDIIRTLAVPGALTLAALIVVFGAIRPAIKAAQPLPPTEEDKAKLDAVVDDVNELPAVEGADGTQALGADGQALAALEGPKVDQRLEAARTLARENPLAMANLLRGWVSN